MPYHPWRWFVFSIFVLSSTLNYLNRFLLNQLAPLILSDLRFSQTSFGWLLSLTAVAYAVSAPLMGWFFVRVGVNRGISTAVVWWSLAEIGSGLVNGLGGLFVFRSALGLGELAGVPAASKVNGLYLKPGERALGAAVNGVGLSIGSAIAPLWIGTALAHSWRAPFIWTGLLGFVWIPLWLFVSRRIPAPQGEDSALHGVSLEAKPRSAILRDRSLILLTIANA